MKKRIDEEMYIEIFKDIIRDNNDYGDKSKVRKHNAAATKIAKQIEKIEDIEYLSQMYLNLLNNQDEMIRHWVASDCLNKKVNEDKAVEILKQIAKNNPDKEFFVNLVLKQHNKL